MDRNTEQSAERIEERNGSHVGFFALKFAHDLVLRLLEVVLAFENLPIEITELIALGYETLPSAVVGVLQCLPSGLNARLSAPHVSDLSVRKLTSGLSSRIERLRSKGSILARLIMILGAEAYVAHENLQAKQAQARPADTNEMMLII